MFIHLFTHCLWQLLHYSDRVGTDTLRPAKTLKYLTFDILLKKSKSVLSSGYMQNKHKCKSPFPVEFHQFRQMKRAK